MKKEIRQEIARIRIDLMGCWLRLDPSLKAKSLWYAAGVAVVPQGRREVWSGKGTVFDSQVFRVHAIDAERISYVFHSLFQDVFSHYPLSLEQIRRVARRLGEASSRADAPDVHEEVNHLLNEARAILDELDTGEFDRDAAIEDSAPERDSRVLV